MGSCDWLMMRRVALMKTLSVMNEIEPELSVVFDDGCSVQRAGVKVGWPLGKVL